MKLYNKILSALAMGSMVLASCTDLDTFPQSGSFTEEQKQDVVGMLPERLAADIVGMYSNNLQQFTVFGSKSGRGDDFGYPAVCLSNDLNGPDMVAPNNGYNWFSTCSEYSDRSDTYANPYMRWALFYNQIKMANDILNSIPDDTTDPTLLSYRGQAKAIRAFDYLNVAPYFQFKYKGNEEKPCIPLVTEEMAADPNNPRATVQAVYDLIIRDLTDAINDLEGYTRKDKSEIDQKIAYGLRARANLYMENWQAAADDAVKAMAGYTPYQRAELTKPMFVSSDESGWMWALEITEADYNADNSLISWPGVIGSFCEGSYSAGVGMYKSINVLLFNLISDTDVRKGWWVDENLHSDNLKGQSWRGLASGDDIATLTVANQGKAAFLPYTNVKFGMYGGLGTNAAANDWPLMRVEEMILIQAEATAMGGNPSDGKQILESFVKTYRDEQYSCKASDAAGVQNAVWLQRRIELWGEGFSMADVMRLGRNVVRVKNGVATNFPDAYAFNVAADNGWLLMRIPQDETNANTGIPPTANNSDGTMPKPGEGIGLTDGVIN
ncbi:RagB/SusD family nutrient uptake outer membrane protein [uncultured Bacteroides sp.]|uniref:RagB/SusD family nutrient uptake outer membrane protein n=1 Tax=uncultured Bacteroides sp. TaxID=162156 RepID=UPI0025CE0B24|nr:RagB/SusD family nutrient uptake outer membrane protein [uncultured Bacteroides sp.]